MLPDVGADHFLEIGNGGEDAASDRSPGDDGEEVFDRIEPGARGRREMERPAGIFGEPFEHLGMGGSEASRSAIARVASGSARAAPRGNLTLVPKPAN